MAEGEKGKGEKGAGPAFSTNQLIIIAFLFVLSFGLLVAMNAAMNAAGSAISSMPILNLFMPILNLFFTAQSPVPLDGSPVSPMFFLMPIVSFFFIFFIVDWVNSYFKTRLALHPLFILLFFFLCFFAFYVALFWYNTNYADLAGQKLLVCVSDNIGGPFSTCNDIINSLIEQGKLNEFLVVDFWERLHGNAFMLFIWGGVFGWITRFAIEKIKL